jgi:FixJ family two-component response regulator
LNRSLQLVPAEKSSKQQMALSEQRGFVHVIDDNETFRKTIEGRLKQFGYEVSTCPSAQHLLDSLPGENVPSCILLDVRLPGMSGPELQGRLRELGSTLPIIFLTGYPDIRTTVRVIKGGGDDFLIKPISSDQLLQAVERAIAHHDAVLGLKKMREAVLSHLATLTPRERQVFELVIRGNSNKAIGNALGATERTIKAHRQSVMEKMQVRSLTELVSVAERVGILRDPPGSR